MTDQRDQTRLLDQLSAKQREVLGMVSEGLTSKEIARKLGITESAVNQRIESIRQRLGGLPRSQIARLYRHQNTLLITLPTSNSLTGKPIQLQLDGQADQSFAAEGAAEFTKSSLGDVSGVLQPSTFPSIWDGPGAIWLRLGLIVGIALGMIATTVLALDAIDKLSNLIGGRG